MLVKSVLKSLGVFSLLVIAGALAGCGADNGSKEGVSGKVTIGGQPVAGEICFTAPNGNEFKSPLAPDGGYEIVKPPKGDAKVTIKPMPAASPPPDGKVKEMPGMPSTGSAGVAPPAKYGKVESSGLTYRVKGGVEKKDFTLDP